jgi:hypothetical protein
LSMWVGEMPGVGATVLVLSVCPRVSLLHAGRRAEGGC